MDDTEERLRCIWREILQIEEVPPDADFFEISGSSLDAVDLARRVSSEFGQDITILDILDFSSFAEFAGRVREASELPFRPEGSGGGPGRAEGFRLRPSMLQEQSLRVDSTGPPSDRFLLRFGYVIRGELDVPRLSRSIELLARRHELLRATLGWRNEEAFLEIFDEAVPRLQIIDAPIPPGVTSDEHVRHVALERPELTPNRDEPPLVRFALLRMGEDLHALVIAIDHMICDGFSIRLLLSDISKIYSALSVNPSFRPDDVPRPFSRWAHEQRTLLCGERFARLIDHWRAVLGEDSGILSPPLPWSDLRPDGALSHTHDLDDEARRRFAVAARRHRMSPFSVAVAALGTSIAEIVGPERACLTTSWLNRDTPAQMEVFGPVSHDIYLRLRSDLSQPMERRLDLARIAIHDALEHAEVPGLVLFQHLWPTSTADPTLQPAVYAAVNEPWASGLKLDGTDIHGVGIEVSQSGRDLTCEFTIESGTVSRIDLSSASSGISPGFMAELIGRIESNVG